MAIVFQAKAKCSFLQLLLLLCCVKPTAAAVLSDQQQCCKKPQLILLTYQLIRKHAAQLASRIGVEVRTHVIDLGVHRWNAVDESVKAPILQRIMDKFDLQGDPIDVEKAVATQCGRRLSNHNFVLHKKYKKLKETRGEEYARNNPPAGVNPEQWTSLVTKKWTVPKWLVISFTGEIVMVLLIACCFWILLKKPHPKLETLIVFSVGLWSCRSDQKKTPQTGSLIEAANNKIDELALAKEEQGKTLASVMAYLKQQGFTG
ncbi:hypothetical protein RHGRI_029569 [Rhododendron griersonianum]|uniref:Uncharacterized protein n=1 Tax=Rhododendron griersonianum TaxID=479676 RepID=A0AAV6IKI6_9ERIC|nr:hypothetical protein RHGRI_029569 [Rhododendron griersonianum]